MTTTPDGPTLPLCPDCSTAACPGECAGDCDGHCGPECAEQSTPVRLDLPVASRRNAMGVFESTSETLGAKQALSPSDALALLDKVLAANIPVARIKISGPGDPMATPITIFDTLVGVRERLPEVEIDLVTNGLGVTEHADALAEAGVTHATILVDSVDPNVTAKLFVWVRPGKRTLNLDKAAPLLVEEQLAAVRELTERSIRVTVRSTLYPGLNADVLPETAGILAENGAKSLNLIRMESTTDEMWDGVRAAIAEHLPVTQGGCDCPEHLVDFASLPQGQALLSDGAMQASMTIPGGERPYVAVASTGGMEVDCHLGQAQSLLIYGKARGTSEEGMVKLLETRPAPPAGGGAERWNWLAHSLRDCSMLLAAGAGEKPREVLAERGIRVVVTDGEIDATVDSIYGGGKKGKGRKK